MKTLLAIFLICISIRAYGQNGITFEIEELSQPERLLRLEAYDRIYQNLILKEAGLDKWEVEEKGIDFKYNIIAKSQAPDSLVSFGYHSFFQGMYAAYAEHRPFVLSPDMIWLLISQGFARHVNANPEELRKYFVDFSGKLSLIVKSNSDLLRDSVNWNDIFAEFTSQIAKHTGTELINTLTCDFSTSTPIEKIASEITIMEAMEPYFEYIIMYFVCGIPEITLQGTTEDWQKILDKTRKLARYDLKWWTDELEPILEEFVDASKGDISKRFWRKMFKYHTPEEYGAPNIIDGWIVKFFPYDKDGKRNNLDELVGGDNLPEEMVKVDVKYIITDGRITEEIPLELWAGFVGLEQNPETFALTPKISWMVKKKDADKTGQLQKLESVNIPGGDRIWSNGIELKIIEVPEILKNLSEIYSLTLHFKKDVYIPHWLKDIRIGILDIAGNISDAETEKIISWFPNTDLSINRKKYNEGKSGWKIINGNRIPDDVLELKEIWVLEIYNSNYNDEKFTVPEALKNIKIANLALMNEASPETIKKLLELLPETNIYMQGKKMNNINLPSKQGKVLNENP